MFYQLRKERSIKKRNLWLTLKEELIDVFMYLLKLFVLLKIDVDKEFFKKLEFNKKRFAKYKVE